ncbi:MAG: hypothetical protein EOM73_16245 [Bacteroidia bacterium]|nr:hypothetical protein [Bacteroidia bacterium]
MVYDQSDFSEVGRHGYRRSAYFKALMYKCSAGIKYISDLVRDLESRPILAEMCGFNLKSARINNKMGILSINQNITVP